MLYTQAIAPSGKVLSETEILASLHRGLGGRFTRQKIIVLIPDHTRSLPLPFLFRALVEILHDAQQLDFMVALGGLDLCPTNRYVELECCRPGPAKE